MEKVVAIAKINDRLRKAMSLGQLTIDLSESVAASADRSAILKAVREYKDFDPELDVNGDHSLGVVLVSREAYVFRMSYGDERYDYAQEVGKRTLSIVHLSEFRSLKLGRKVQDSAKRILAQERVDAGL